MRSRVVSVVIAVIALGTTGCVAASQVSGPGGGSSILQSGSTSTCPPAIDRDGPLGFSATTRRSLVDPSTTQVLVCRYASTVGQVEVWQLQAQGVLAGGRRTTLVTQVSAAPAANLLMRGCPISAREEPWFFETGKTVTAQLRVQLDGCPSASDGTRTVSWGNGDPLTS